MGLYYEHQHPDAGDHVGFNCRALQDWNNVRTLIKRISDDREPAFAGMSLDDKLELLSESTLLPFIHKSASTDPLSVAVATTSQKSTSSKR